MFEKHVGRGMHFNIKCTFKNGDCKCQFRHVHVDLQYEALTDLSKNNIPF